jgi:hypothetical protein
MMSERARRGRRCKIRGGRKKKEEERDGDGEEEENGFRNVLWDEKKKKEEAGDGEENVRLRERWGKKMKR